MIGPAAAKEVTHVRTVDEAIKTIHDFEKSAETAYMTDAW